MRRKLPLFSCLCLFLLATAAVFTARPSGDVSKNARSAVKSRLAESYGRLPLSFELNRGQTDPQVKFLSRGNGYTLFLNSTEAVLSLRKPGAGHGRAKHSRRARLTHAVKHQIAPAASAVLRMNLVGANPEPGIEGQTVPDALHNPYVNHQSISENYFELMKIPLQAGRLFTRFDGKDGEPVRS